MNRKSLFGRFAAPITARRTAERPEHHRVHLEPLEDRKVLATFYVNDTWQMNDPNDTTLDSGDNVVTNAGVDPQNPTRTGTYGVTVFGTVTGATSVVTGKNYLTLEDDGSRGLRIADAIFAAANTGDTVSVMEGTYTESDIVVDKQRLTLKGTVTGTFAAGTLSYKSKIVPEVVSARAEAEFADNSHSGIIIYAGSVTVSNLYLDGSGNASIAGSFNYHHGVTTIYTRQYDGANTASYHDYQTLRNGNLAAADAFSYNISGNQSNPFIHVEQMRVENAWFHGITLAAPEGKQWRRSGGGLQNDVNFSIVTNVGDSGNQGANHVGIMLQNVREPPDATLTANLTNNNVTNAGIGIWTRASADAVAVPGAILSVTNDNGARSYTTMIFNTITNSKLEGLRFQNNDGGDGIVGNIISFPDSANTAIGMHIIHSEAFPVSNNTITNAFIGIDIENSDSGYSGSDGQAPILAVGLKIIGRPSKPAGSIGIRSENGGPFGGVNTDTGFLLTEQVSVTNYATGVRIAQTVASNRASFVAIDRAEVNGNTVGYNIGAGVIIQGQFNTTDPVIDPGTTLSPAYYPNLLEQYGNAVSVQETHPAYIRSLISGVDTGTDVIATVGQPFPWATGQAVKIDDPGTGTSRPGGTNGDKRWMRVIDNEHFTLHTTKAGALANTGIIDVTSAGAGTPYVQVMPEDYTVTVPTLPKPVTISTGSLTLGADTIFNPVLNGVAGTTYTPLETFANAFTYSTLTNEDQVNPWNISYQSPARLGLWSSSGMVQNGAGTLLINQTTPVGAALNGDVGVQVDASSYNNVRIVVRRGSTANSVKHFALGIVDADGTADVWFLPTNVLDTVNYTTFDLNLLSPPVRFVDGDGLMNLSKITGWAVAGDLAFSDFKPVLNNLSVEVNEIGFSKGPAASLVSVTGGVTLGAGVATLSPSFGDQFVSSLGQKFTIVSNDAADAVSGTFKSPLGANLPEGTTFQAGSAYFRISYKGLDESTGNDVVLTEVSAPPVTSTVVGRRIFYNTSKFDGVNASINASDDLAIATDKSAYIAGTGQSTYTNLTNYNRGVNGIMIDLLGGGNHTSISLATIANDFIFKVGNNNTPVSWAAAPAPNAVSVRTGAGTSGSDRVVLTWADNVKNKWLEIQVLATANTGLAATDVFFFGNLLGETANPAGNFSSTVSADGGPILTFGTKTSVGITNVFDIDRSNSVTTAGDRGPIVAQGTQTVVRINITGGPFAPEGGGGGLGGGDAGIASALAASSGSSTSSSTSQALPGAVVERLDSGSAGGGSAATDAALASTATEEADGDGDSDLDELLDSLASGA